MSEESRSRGPREGLCGDDWRNNWKDKKEKEGLRKDLQLMGKEGVKGRKRVAVGNEERFQKCLF